MQFIQSDTPKPGTKALYETLTDHLKHDETVLWMVCGGSSIGPIAAVMAELPAELTPKLHIMLSDERFGPVGHPDSNDFQLLSHGFDPKLGNWHKILTEASATDLKTCISAYQTTVHGILAENPYIIATLGIGSDGHIAGILPHSPAATSGDTVIGYEAQPFVRMTVGFSVLSKIDYAISIVFGQDKQAALLRLRDENIPLPDQPSQILKQLAVSFVVNNQIGDIKK